MRWRKVFKVFLVVSCLIGALGALGRYEEYRAMLPWLLLAGVYFMTKPEDL